MLYKPNKKSLILRIPAEFVAEDCVLHDIHQRYSDELRLFRVIDMHPDSSHAIRALPYYRGVRQGRLV